MDILAGVHDVIGTRKINIDRGEVVAEVNIIFSGAYHIMYTS